MPKRANNVTMYTMRVNQQAKVPENYRLHKLEAVKNETQNNMVPGHVRASINWNNLKQANSDQYSLPINDGMKVIVCKLRNNPMGYTSVAYPTDELRLPKWFQELPFEDDEMESTIIDKKLDNLIGVLDWDIKSTEQKTTFNNLFDFE